MSNTEPGPERGSPAPRNQLDCGDVEQEALHEVAEAKGNAAKAEDELKHALHDVEQAEHKLEKAEADLEEARRHEAIHFWVDGEEYKTKQREWTPNAIVKEFGGRDPATNYLVRIEGHHRESFEGKGDIPIKLHDCERFQVISTGPTPVSDGNVRTGVEIFVAGLQALGYEPTALPHKLNHILIDYTVESGTHKGRQVHLGLIVPPDFPMTPPGGPHVSPSIHVFQNGGNHPTGGILQSADFQAGAGGQWQYWSRPFKDWGKSKKTVATYMSHVWRLWDTQ